MSEDFLKYRLPDDCKEFLKTYCKYKYRTKVSEVLEDVGRSVSFETFQSKEITDLAKLAQQGEIEAQFKLARFYENIDNKIDNAWGKAFYWYTKAALGGHVPAQYVLAHMYERASFIKGYKAKAFSWYNRAARNGYVEAQVLLGSHLSGKNPELAAYWWEKAALQGDESAQYQIAKCYEEGNGVKQDYYKALCWWKEIANINDTAALKIAEYYAKGYGVIRNTELAWKWYRTAAEQGNVKAILKIAKKYEKLGERLEALYWWNEAAEANNTRALLELAQYYESQDCLGKAAKYYQKAVDNGSFKAKPFLAQYYYDKAVHSEKESKEAFDWYLNAALNGCVEAMFQTAQCYENGYGVDVNYSLAFRWYSDAAENGHTEAKYKKFHVFPHERE